MRVIIVGGGGIGEATAKRLIAGGMRLTIIEHNPKVCERLVQTLPKAEVICGEAANPHVLEQSGIKDVDVFVSATGEDDTNVMTAVLAKNFKVKRIIVRVRDPAYIETCKMIGLNIMVNPSESAALQIDSLLRGISLIDIIGLARKDVEVIEMLIDEYSVYVDYSLAEIDIAEDKSLHPVLIIRGDEVELPKPNFKFKVGDRLLLLRKKGFFESIL